MARPKRKISEKIKLSGSALRIEELNWEDNAEDFAELCKIILDDLRTDLLSRGIELGNIAELSELKREVRHSAETYNPRHGCLYIHIFFWVREFLIRKARG
jgi:hypothetical protein